MSAQHDGKTIERWEQGARPRTHLEEYAGALALLHEATP